MSKSTCVRAAVLLAAVLATSGSPTARVDADPPEHVPPVAGTEYVDMGTRERVYELHDVMHVNLHAAKKQMHVWVEFAQPLRKGMYEGIDLEIDCDGNPKTGRNGSELDIRVSVGSRFRANTEKTPPRGQQPAFLMRTAGWASPDEAGRLEGWTWRGTKPIEKPRVNESTVYFTFPLDLLTKHGLRYNKTIGVRLLAEGVIAEQPIYVEYRCVDEGIPIAIDGVDGDWSGGPRTHDTTGELHPAAAGIDIRDLQVEHDADSLFARLRLASDGFASYRLPPDGDDVTVFDEVVFAFEPIGNGRYMEYQTLPVSIQHLEGKSSTGSWAAGTRFVEARVKRPPEQTEVRVMAWSEAVRHDSVPNIGWLVYEIPDAAWRD